MHVLGRGRDGQLEHQDQQRQQEESLRRRAPAAAGDFPHDESGGHGKTEQR